MRQPKYLSPSGISKFFDDRNEFYLSYMADNRPPRMKQTRPMSVGSAFDAYVKNYLVKMLHGTVKPEFEIKTILEAQVEEQNREWAYIAGKNAFDQYKASGALADLMIELEQAVDEPQFEFTAQAKIAHEDFVDGIPLLGKPDVYFKTKGGVNVILDWKVNGYCAKRNKSPAKGYIKCRDGWSDREYKESRNNGGPHKDCQMMKISGIPVNITHCLSEVEKSWARQTVIYLWILGEPIGTKAIVGIDQLCGVPREDGHVSIRVATHRCRASEKFQIDLMAQIHEVWTAVQSGHIFTDMTRDENDVYCAKLDNYHLAYARDENSNDNWEDWFTDITRG